jgi:WD40 repeat protein
MHKKTVSLCLFNQASNRLISVSLDGSIHFWDPTTLKSVCFFIPCEDQKLKSIGNNALKTLHCVDVDISGRWMICAGSSNLIALYYLPSQTLIKTYSLEMGSGTPSQIFRCLFWEECVRNENYSKYFI